MPKVINKITLKSFGKGSKCPELTKGHLRLYNMRFCPYAERCVLVLEAKKIPHEVVNIDLVDKPEWYFEKNSEGKVPALEQDGDVLLAESLVVCEYLDEAYPENPLHPSDPLRKANNNMLLARFGKVTSAFVPLFKQSLTAEQIKSNWEDLESGLDSFEKELLKRGSRFFHGDKLPGMLDFSIWPWFERLKAIPLYIRARVQAEGQGGQEGPELELKLSEKRFPKLNGWVSDMLTNPVIQKVAFPPETFLAYMKSRDRNNGKPDYDMGL